MGDDSARRVRDQHRRLELTKEGPRHGSRNSFADAFASLGLDNSFDIERFAKGLRIEVVKADFWKCEFDLMGVDPPIANAFRRVLLSEVPTVAIGKVDIYQNTGVLHDEVLAHRLGLIPIRVDPDKCKWPDDAETETPLKFKLHVKCTNGDPQKQQKAPVSELTVRSGDLVWEHQSSAQKALFEGCEPRPVHDDVLITKLKPGQELELEAILEKGVGRDHAKWSPVCTAFYRLMPEIELMDTSGFLTAGGGFPATAAGKKVAILEEGAEAAYFRDRQGSAFQAKEVVECKTNAEMWGKLREKKVHAVFCSLPTARLCPAFEDYEFLHPQATFFFGENAELLMELAPGVFELQDGGVAVVNARALTTGMGQNLIERFGDKVRVYKVKDHFIFSVESTGIIPAPDLFRRAIAVFKQKLQGALQVLREQKTADSGG